MNELIEISITPVNQFQQPDFFFGFEETITLIAKQNHLYSNHAKYFYFTDRQILYSKIEDNISLQFVDNINLPILVKFFCVGFPFPLLFSGVTQKVQLTICGTKWTWYSCFETLPLTIKLLSLHITFVSYEVALSDFCHVMFVVNERFDWVMLMLSIATSGGAAWKVHTFISRNNSDINTSRPIPDEERKLT